MALSQYSGINFSDNELERYKEAFSLFDKDGSGTISTRELGSVFRVLGQNPTDGELYDAIQDFVSAFSILDAKASGYVDARELMQLITTLGEKLSEDEAEILVRNVGIDSLGRVNVMKLVQTLQS
eukprot:GSMAST32.ASY1.ANO1.644.1 assembled CDS